MFKEFLRKEFLEKHYGIYMKILEVYHEEMLRLETPSRFRRWIAIELDIPVEEIKLRSLNSAFHKQKIKQTIVSKNETDVDKNNTMNKPQQTIYRFTEPNSGDKKPNTIMEE